MTEEDLTILILDTLGWDFDTDISSGYKNSKPIILGTLIIEILKYKSLPKVSESLDIGYKALNTAVQKLFVPLFGKINGGNESWAFILLDVIQYKKCPHCQEYLPYLKFGIDRSTGTGRHNKCLICRSVQNAIEYRKPSTQEAHKKSHEKHYSDILARNAEYRAQRSFRNVSWADKEKIKQIYNNCPEGLHVDHIIPLKGELVSGLHVDTNLQYLSPEENIKKGNKYLIE